MDLEEIEKIDRAFLHDIATPIAIAKGMISKVHANLLAAANDPFLEEQLKRIEKALEALKKLEHLHADQKERIHSRKISDKKTG